jgi:hypothetical protein
MPRYRRRETRWVHGASVAGGYLVVVASLFGLQLGAGLTVPVSVAVSAPPLVYAALAMVLLREAPFVRRLSWVGSACVAHVLLGALAAAELAWAADLSLPTALAQVFALFPPALLLTLVATPLILVAFGLTSSRPVRRAEPALRPAAPVRTKPLASPVRVTPPPSPVAHSTMSAVAPPPAPPSVVPPAPPPVIPPAKPPRRGDDGMVRVSFARISAQLPAEAFVLPFERLSESLREPHLVLVPRRVVLSQMHDGTVAITWAHIASQFPDLALGMSDDEFRKQYPDLKLWLPMEELASQLPAGSIPGARAPEADRVATVPAPVAPTSNGPANSLVAPAPAIEVTPTLSRVEPVDRDVMNAVVACFNGIGTFEGATERIADITVVALAEPGLRRDAVSACAAPLVRSLAAASADVITLRTERAVVVLAVAPTPVVVAARRPGAPIALLAQRAARAAAAVGRGAPSLPPPARPALEPVGVDGAVAQAAQAVRSLGAVDATAFADGPARVYVVSAGGGDDKAVAALALGLCNALGADGDLGRAHTVLFQRGDAHTLVRPLRRGGVLAVTGAVTRPGRLLKEAERAATLLEAI